MIPFQPSTIDFVCGPVRSGKTYLIDQWCKEEPRLVRFDVTGETIEDPSMFHIWHSPKQLHDYLKESPYAYRVAYHPGDELRDDFEWCSKILWRMNAPKVLVCDEFHEVCDVNDTPKWVRTMTRYARHAKMGLIAASQRIADVHKLFTSSANMVVLFQTMEARDLDAIQSRWRCAEMVEGLRPLIYNDNTRVTSQIPQCVVIQKGTKPRIYDFQTDTFTTSTSASHVTVPDSDKEQTEQTDEQDTGGSDLAGELPPDDLSGGDDEL